MQWIRQIFSRRRRYDDLSTSIEEHIAEKTDELVEEGMPRREAEQAARRQFGNPALIAQRSREAWQWPALEAVLYDLKLALRRMGKSPGFSAAVILTLAIGIGANTAVFSVLNSVVLRPLPYPNSDRLVSIWLHAPGAAGLTNFQEGLRLSPSMYLTFAEHNRSFESIGVWVSGAANITGLAQPERVHTTYISDGVLETLNVPPAAGRWLGTADQQPRSSSAIMLSYGYWQRRFGGDPSAVGRSIMVDAQARQIVGVMPKGFQLVNQDFDLLIPFAFDPRHQILAGFGYNGIARLKPGVTIGQASADISSMLPVWMDSWSNGPGTNSHFYETWKIVPAIRPLKQEVIGNVASVLWVVMGTIGVVMLIACTNVANLLLVRAESRHQELAIRAALGAGRARIARELLLECGWLSLLGGVAGIGIAWAGLRLLAASGPANLPRLGEISLDARSIVFTLVLSLASGLFFGSITALKNVRSLLSLAHASAGRTVSASRERKRGRSVLVIAQVAMAMVLLVSAALMIRTLQALRRVDPGFADADHLQTLRISIPESLIADPKMAARLENDIADKLAAIPGVRAAAFASNLPLDGIEPDWDEIRIEGKSYLKDDPPLRFFSYVSPGYFSAAGTRLVAGRDYTWTDIYGFRPFGIISENLARESWGSAAAAIGKRFRVSSGQPWMQVIGVAQDVRQNGVDEQAPAIVYWPSMVDSPYAADKIETARAGAFVVRSDRAGSESLMGEIQQAVWSVNPNLPVASIQTMGDLYERSMARTSFTLVMLAIAGAMALALGILGIYGVISYSVTQRTREIGVRMALGAQKGELKWMFVRSAMALTGIGVVIGLVTAAGLTQLMKSVLFGISPLDPVTFAAVPVVLAAAAAMASYFPARRAASVNPVSALRAD
jgi:predicted permease